MKAKARANPIRFLLNQPVKDDADDGAATDPNDPVTAPAFSITKVSATIATLVAPAAVAILQAFTDQDFSTVHLVVMFVSLLGFLAIATAADVLARAYSSGQASLSETVLNLPTPVPATLAAQGADPKVDVLAFASGGGGRFLVKLDDDTIKWVELSKVTISPA